MSIFATAGTVVEIGGAITATNEMTESDYAGLTWKVIGETENLGQFGDTASEIAFEGIGDARVRTLKGTRNAGSLEIVCGFDESDEGQAALIAAETQIHDYAFRVTLNNAPPVKSATVTVSIASPGVVTWTGHGLPNGTALQLTTTGALPTGLTPSTTYYVVGATANTFSLAATKGGAAINTSGTQSGTHTATTRPVGSRRWFAGKVMSQALQLDAANNVVKLNGTVRINSNIVGHGPLG